ncbi:MAG TPA: serine/threonine-protein kinase [Abditibacteriaceae bacterium]|jgi:serine/threonine protein kinase
MYQLRHDIGEVIKERYTIRQVLGAGAFGTVYRVEETIGARIVTLACKEMHVLSDPGTTVDEREEALRMFQEEAYLLQTLRNVHIPAAYFESTKGVWLACPVCGRTFKGARVCPDHGAQLQVVKERFYLIMDFIEGPDLEELLLQNGGRPLEEESVLDWALQICDALEAVHNKGLSHRDIKPANIKLYKDSNQAMLIDFGLVKPSNAAGAFGTMLKRGSTGAGTVGYAPESQQEQMNPDARTDILALGMTLYRLLTCLDPTEPDDLATMRRGAPSGTNLRLSSLTDAIIVRAIQNDPAKRYPNVAELRRDLRAARYPVQTTCEWCGHVQHSASRPDADTPCDRCGRPLLSQSGGRTQRAAQAPPRAASARTPTGTTLSSRTNPHQARIDDLRLELARPQATPSHPLDTRIAQLEATLAEVARQSVGNTMQCPGCRRNDLVQITGQPTGRCPLCDNARLLRRQWDESLCPVCRQGKLHDHQLQGDQMFCPVCRAMPLQEEKRKQFGGLLVDLWASCPHCEARFDIENGGRATLEEYKDDPYGIGVAHGKETLPITEWRRLSQRPDKYSGCDSCHAIFAIREDDRRVLIRHETDPFGVAAQYHDQALTRDEWAKLASRMSLAMGNLHCPNCQAEWDFDRNAQTLNLLGAAKMPPWAVGKVGQPQPLSAWSAAAAGKTSTRPGWLCRDCKTEFDTEGNVLKLVATSAPSLSRFVGQMLTLEDWQRRGRGLPTGTEAHELRNELTRLQAQRHTDRNQSMRTQASLRAGLEAELLQLLKQSVMKGYIPLKRISQYAPGGNAGNDTHINLNGNGARIPLRASEVLRWESPARLCSVRIVNNRMEWRQEAEGTLVISSERVLFGHNDQDTPLFQRSMQRLKTVEIEPVENVPVVVLTFTGFSDVVGFIVGDVRWEITLDDKNYTLTFSTQELVEIILQQQLTP